MPHVPFSLRLVLFLLGASLSACPAPTPPPTAPSLVGDGWVVTAVDGGAFDFTRGDTPLLRFGLDAFQVGTVRALDDALSYDPYWLVVDDGAFTPTLPPGFRWRAATAASAALEGGALVLRLTYEGGVSAVVRVAKSEAGQVALRFIPDVGASTHAIAYLRVQARADQREAFYGLGEWFDGANHRGKLRPMQLEPDLRTESAASENHVVTPLLIGSTGWGLFVQTNRPGLFDVARADDELVDTQWGTAEASAEGLTVHLFAAASPLDVLKPYYAVTGAPRLPAPWALGPWIWRDETAGQSEVLEDIANLRQLDLATSAVWIDRPYATDVNTFDFDAAKYADAGAMLETARQQGLGVALWHTPYLAPGAQPLRAQADAAQFFPPQQGPMLNRWSPPLDFTRPGASDFWTGHVGSYVAQGIQGFKLDFAEDVVTGLSGRRAGWTFADGSTERTMHAQYTRLYHAAYRAALGANDGFLLVRSGKWGTQTEGVIVWPGDIDATLTEFGEAFDRGGKRVVGVGGLPSAIRAGTGLAMSGFPLFAADTGGYRHSPPDKETFIRWVQQSALMPVMQTGDSSSQPPWVFTPENGRDAEALEVYRQFARLHLRLFPFLWTHLKRMAVDGRPVVRPFGAAFPALQQHPEDQYLLGDELLVAPVATAGVRQRAVTKPEGAWRSWWTGEVLAGAPGEAVTVPAGLLTLPLFLREGALVPMLRPSIDTLSPADDAAVDSFAREAGALWVHVAPSPAPSRFELYDGAVLRQSSASGLVLQATAGAVFKTSVVWEVPGAARPGAVAHGAALQEAASLAALEAGASGWFHDGQALWVKTALDGVETSVR